MVGEVDVFFIREVNRGGVVREVNVFGIVEGE